MDTKVPASFSYGSAGGFVFAVFVAVAVPTFACAIGGRWLDGRFGTGYLFTVLGLFVAFGLTTLLVLRLAKRFTSKT